MTNSVLILGGTGKAGRHATYAFAQAGWQVRHFDRKKDDMNVAARGVDMIFNGLNPPNYHNWQGLIPQITRTVIEAARRNGASVLLPGNVYHFGDQAGIWSEKTAPNPVSRKGRIRHQMEQAYRNSGIQTIILRAGNFIDPARDGCVMSKIYLRSIGRNMITLPGGADIRQAMCYLPDWAKAAVNLALMRRDLAIFEDIPFPGHNFTATQMKSGLETLLQRELTFAKFPWGVVKIIAPFSELARELLDMRYLWNTDHQLCGKRFNALLPQFEASEERNVLSAALPFEMKTKLDKFSDQRDART